MTDAREKLRAALAAGPTLGPWPWHVVWGNGRRACSVKVDRYVTVATIPAGIRRTADADYIAACDPSTIARLLADADALAEIHDRIDADIGKNFCTVCRRPVRYGERHHWCGNAVMVLEAERDRERERADRLVKKINEHNAMVLANCGHTGACTGFLKAGKTCAGCPRQWLIAADEKGAG